jgi:hypothetical protein
MGVCVFCGKPAGMFAVAHKRCRDQRAAAVQRMAALFEPFLSGSVRADVFARLLNESADMNLIQRHEIPDLIPGWLEMTLADLSKRRPPTAHERARAWVLMAHYAVSTRDDTPEWVRLWGHLDVVAPGGERRSNGGVAA